MTRWAALAFMLGLGGCSAQAWRDMNNQIDPWSADNIAHRNEMSSYAYMHQSDDLDCKLRAQETFAQQRASLRGDILGLEAQGWSNQIYDMCMQAAAARNNP